MASFLAQAIREARVTVRLTQEQLGMRVGLRGRAVYRWERGAAVPRRRHRRALVTAIQAVDPRAAAKLGAAFERYQGGRGAVTAAPEAPAAIPGVPASPSGTLALDLALFAMADELDLAPRRLRVAVARLLARYERAGFSLDAARQHVESCIAQAHDAALSVPSQVRDLRGDPAMHARHAVESLQDDGSFSSLTQTVK